MGRDNRDGLHTGHLLQVVVPFRSILVDWHVELIEGLVFKWVVVFQGVRLDQDPCSPGLLSKVTVDWKGDVLIVQNLENTILLLICRWHNFPAGSRR